tara:strand:- start:512 stop:847 length:336 start_codon:yes stop_codon:yes gene_type:complete
MSSISSLLGWALLLSFALLGPVALPAGGASLSRNSLRRSEESGPHFAGDCCELRASPSSKAPSLRIIRAGTPLRVLRKWHGVNGNYWIQVQILSFNLEKLGDSATRGWVSI